MDKVNQILLEISFLYQVRYFTLQVEFESKIYESDAVFAVKVDKEKLISATRTFLIYRNKKFIRRKCRGLLTSLNDFL